MSGRNKNRIGTKIKKYSNADLASRPKPDKLTQEIGVLTRRETEARILAPLVEALAAEFGRERVESILAETIKKLARQQGRQMAEEYGNSVEAFLETLEFWMRDGALEIDILDKSSTRLNFNVTRCRYAELYESLGIKDIGAVLSCNRDFTLIEGFNPSARLERNQTIMAGAKCCTFRYQFPDPKPQDE